MAVRRTFAEEVKHREAERKHTSSHTRSAYALRELKDSFLQAHDGRRDQGQCQREEKAFRRHFNRSGQARELNSCGGMPSPARMLYRNLIRIYDQHNRRNVTARRSLELEEKAIPRIVCSEASCLDWWCIADISSPAIIIPTGSHFRSRVRESSLFWMPDQVRHDE